MHFALARFQFYKMKENYSKGLNFKLVKSIIKWRLHFQAICQVALSNSGYIVSPLLIFWICWLRIQQKPHVKWLMNSSNNFQINVLYSVRRMIFKLYAYDAVFLVA